MTQGIQVFSSLHEAAAEGFEFYSRDRQDSREYSVCLVRKRTVNGWALAIVRLAIGAERE